MIGTQITVSPLCGWNLGPEGQRREWAGLSFAFPLEGTREDDNDDGDDYENMAPPYKDLPPKPGKRTSQKPGEGMCGLWPGESRVPKGHYLGMRDTESASCVPSLCQVPCWWEYLSDGRGSSGHSLR